MGRERTCKMGGVAVASEAASPADKVLSPAAELLKEPTEDWSDEADVDDCSDASELEREEDRTLSSLEERLPSFISLVLLSSAKPGSRKAEDCCNLGSRATATMPPCTQQSSGTARLAACRSLWILERMEASGQPEGQTTASVSSAMIRLRGVSGLTTCLKASF